ncbi:MAG TPA: isoleucine--tRNA ligase [Longimicrobiales bacterium]|nr:isoleucine--tRNA ligase [Longimicrobiales bacterium]
MRYPEFPESWVALEEDVLARWREEDLFRRTLAATEGAEEFVFYEGPPTANGRPGLHHVLARTFKDLFCRYQTMRGRHVTRIAGWDTHGLPVEIEAEKKLGISGKKDIEEVGTARFNDVCRESVFTYQEEWERLSERIGYWLDYSDPYITYAPDYIESVWWILKQLAEKDLLYRGFKSVPYCPRCGTALSSHEVAQGYEDVEDPSLFFLAEALDRSGAPDGRFFLAWTTTPWTVPANVGLAVHPELMYAEVEHDGRRLILADARIEALFGEDAKVLRRFPAAELVGTSYRRPFDLVPEPAERGNAWTVVGEDFVSADDGTGIVHLAPAFGSDDYAAGQRHDLPMLRPLDDAGRFTEDVPLVGGQFVKDADPALVADLDARGLLHEAGTVVHSYPHCWRCGSPLLYMARETWYARTTAFRARMLELNAQVGWSPPEVGRGRFGEWLEGNVDWALSRDRYWGTPLPVWVCDAEDAHVDVIGSFAELAGRAGALPDGFDPHKPGIDAIVWPCATCAGTMARTPEVLDVWFDSGAMPYAQWHYPFEHQAELERHFPADFICEALDQTRGWFYSLLAISTMLGRGAPYRNVMVTGLLVDAEGQKMSKSKGNVVDPWDAVGRFGADAVRWHFITASQPWSEKRFDPEGVAEGMRRTFDTLANTYRFFALYANLEGWSPSQADPAPDQRPVMDRWVLSRLAGLSERVGAALDAYDLTPAARAVGDFVVDDLSNWYVRRSRGRFWGGDDAADTRAAFRTLHEVLVGVSRLLAPFTPFTPDWLHRALLGDESVHLAAFPAGDATLRDTALEGQMQAARMLSSLGRAARDQVKIRVRQPLRSMSAVVPPGTRPTADVLDVLKDELNVKEVRFLDAAEDLVTLRGKPNFRTLGPRFGKRVNAVAGAVREAPSAAVAALHRGEPLVVELDGERLELGPEEVEVEQEARGGTTASSRGRRWPGS